MGDIVGRPGRDWVKERLARYRAEEGIDLVVANAENAAAGSGLTGSIARDLLGAGIDGITLGDHIWDQREWAEEIGQFERVCRPANLPASNPGRTHLVLPLPGGHTLGVVTVLGRQYMKIHADCPFLAADRKMAELAAAGVSHVLVEIHGEATSEKIALGWYLDGRAVAVLGTHTHVPTADAAVLPRGTAYQTDVGMTGPYASVLGREVQSVVARFLDGMPRKFPVAEGDARICGALIEYDCERRLALACGGVQLRRE